MTIETDWSHTTASVPDHGLDAHRTADEAQRREIAAALDLDSLDQLEARYHIAHLANGRFRVSGEIVARVTQACVVTLDPVASDIRTPFAVEFWPAGDIPQLDEGEREALDEDPPEPIEHHRIAVGRIIYETLGAAIDPYPRLPDAELERHEAGGETPEAEHPFAALAKLKRPQD